MRCCLHILHESFGKGGGKNYGTNERKVKLFVPEKCLKKCSIICDRKKCCKETGIKKEDKIEKTISEEELMRELIRSAKPASNVPHYQQIQTERPRAGGLPPKRRESIWASSKRFSASCMPCWLLLQQVLSFLKEGVLLSVNFGTSLLWWLPFSASLDDNLFGQPLREKRKSFFRKKIKRENRIGKTHSFDDAVRFHNANSPPPSSSPAVVSPMESRQKVEIGFGKMGSR